MGCDINFQNTEVRNELTAWGKWYLDTTGANGFRVDAIKNISSCFFPEWLNAMEKYAGKDLFVVGEYWNCDINALLWYIDTVGGKMSVFDVPLHFNFHTAGKQGRSYDMRKLLDGTIMKHNPLRAVTFVENHDSQPLQALESTVEPWFKPLAYAFILLRGEGYPCVFSADYDGASYEDRGRDGNRYRVDIPPFKKLIDIFLQCRRDFCYGVHNDYIDHPNTIGWTKMGDSEHTGSMAVVMGNGDAGSKWMFTGKASTAYSDRTGSIKDTIVTNESGWADFRCEGGSVSVWTESTLC
jgi:alpha-amylase